MCLFGIAFCFLCFVCSCFAYDVELYGSNPGERVLNLVFCPLNYQNKEDFLKDTEIFIRGLKQVAPFDEVMNKLGVWRISISKAEEISIFNPTQDYPPLKVRQDFLDDILFRIKLNYKLIIVDADGSVSCAELSLVDKMSLIVLGKERYKNEDSFAKGFLHELGHSLGLRDECVDCAQLSSAGSPNCAATKEEAQRWWGDLVGKIPQVNYISGCCGNKGYIRPVIASLMNDADKADDFGPVNERYLRGVLGEFSFSSFH